MGDHPQGVVITLGDVYRAVQELTETVSGLPATVNDHETRIRFLERAVWIASGVAAIAGTGLGSLL